MVESSARGGEVKARAGWSDDAADEAGTPVKPLTRDEARALVARQPSWSPWAVWAVQAGVGCVTALVAWGLTGRTEVFWSALYGAGVVVLPGALMARGMTSRLTSMSPGASAVSFMSWELVKIGGSVALLVLANRVVVPLSWPALLAGLVVCIKVYWVALLARRPAKKS